nr:xylulose kinase-1 [Tanacetum cinerariifolium]
MATLKFCDTYNMIAYLKKTKGSEGFHQIVNFLNSSHIKFALTENPTIYTSLIQQFWQTAVANTLDTREIQVTATIDGNVKLISEASIRRHLKLEDSDGISTLPNTEIFDQLALIGQEDQPEDQLRVLSASKILADATRIHTYSRRRRAVSSGSGGVSTASRIISTAKETVSTAGVSMTVSIAGMVQESTSSPRATKDKGKAIMIESKPEQTTTKLRERQKRAGYEAAIRLQEQQDEEEN